MKIFEWNNNYLFKASLKNKTYEKAEDRIGALKQILLIMVYNYVCRSLFKSDRLMFALHLAHSMFSKQFKENVRKFAN
jgi:dynein heavy chain 2